MLKDIGKRLLTWQIATATIGNILAILVLLGVIGSAQVNDINQIVILVGGILIQLGIMKK